MNIGSLGIAGSFSTGQLQQARGADADRVAHEARNQARSAESAQLAEAAAGIGATSEDEGATDRDADGRQLWERRQQQSPGPDAEETPPSDAAPRSLDPSGESGAQVDLTG